MALLRHQRRLGKIGLSGVAAAVLLASLRTATGAGSLGVSGTGAAGSGNAPVLVSAVVTNGAPTQIALTYNKNLNTGSVPATTRFIALNEGRTKYCQSVSISGAVVTLTFGESFYFGEWVTLFYIKPTTNPLEDTGGNDAADLLAQVVTNNIVATGNVYYVDRTTGNDANNGTSPSTPWQTLPGTRTTSNSGFLRSAWGAITTANTVPAGSRINLRPGTTYDSALCGGLQIDSSYYANGTAKNPTMIQVDATWGSGPVTIDGTGMTRPLGTGWGLVTINQRNHIRIKGADATRRIVVRDCAGGYDVFAKGTSGTHQQGVALYHVETTGADASYAGIGLSFSDQALVVDSYSHTNGGNLGCGMILGETADTTCIGTEIRDTEIYNNAPTWDGVTFEGLAHGLQCTGAQQTFCWRVRSHSNARDGFDFGQAAGSGGPLSSATFLDCDTYDNGEDGFGLNGNQTLRPTFTYINCRSFRNTNGWQIYDGPIALLYGCVGYGNSRNIFTYTDSGYQVPDITVRNSIMERVSSRQVDAYTSPGGRYAFMDSDNNLWVASSSLNDAHFWEMSPTGQSRTYSTWSEFGPNDIRTTTRPVFVDAANGNFRLANGSQLASNAGTYLSTPVTALRDGSSSATSPGRERASPPDIGAYEYVA